MSDPSLSLAPIVHQFGWTLDDWERLGRGTLVGHLLECGMQVTGGYFADPGVKDVARLADCGFPLAEVDGDGHATITKLEGTGGLVDRRTVKEQLLYEVHDPSAYLTPDVTADFSRVQVTETGRDRVRLQGASGRERPRTLKVTVGFDGGFLGEAGVSYAGPNAARRARLARDILLERLNRHAGLAGKLRIDIIGLASLHATALGAEAEGKAEPRGCQGARGAALDGPCRCRDHALGGGVAVVLRPGRRRRLSRTDQPERGDAFGADRAGGGRHQAPDAGRMSRTISCTRSPTPGRETRATPRACRCGSTIRATMRWSRSS